MTPEDIGARLAAVLGEPGVEVGVSDGRAYARATVDVPPALWPAAARAARDGSWGWWAQTAVTAGTSGPS